MPQPYPCGEYMGISTVSTLVILMLPTTRVWLLFLPDDNICLFFVHIFFWILKEDTVRWVSARKSDTLKR